MVLVIAVVDVEVLGDNVREVVVVDEGVCVTVESSGLILAVVVGEVEDSGFVMGDKVISDVVVKAVGVVVFSEVVVVSGVGDVVGLGAIVGLVVFVVVSGGAIVVVVSGGLIGVVVCSVIVVGLGVIVVVDILSQ